MSEAKEDLGALNSVLFQQLERLTNDDLSPEELDVEIKRSKAVTHVASTIISNGELALRAARLAYDSGGTGGGSIIPKMLENKN